MPAQLRGIVNVVRLAEKLQLVRPTMGPIHWAMAKGVREGI